MSTLRDILQSTSDALFPAELGQREVSLDSRDSDGDMPLHVILRRKDARAAAVLIEAGADVRAAGDLGLTPLHLAVRAGMADIVSLLVQAGANADARDAFGVSARELAEQQGGALPRLLRRGARR
jgi:ankyrin repeat protein